MFRKEADLQQSSINWPFTRDGSIVVLSISCTMIIAVTVLVEICNNDITCSRTAWPPRLFGERKTNYDGYCEVQRHDRFMAEHMNCISNFTFCFIGLIIAACGVADAIRLGSLFPVIRTILFRTNKADDLEAPCSTNTANKPMPFNSHLVSFPLFSVLLGIFAILLGVGSFMLHAYDSTLTRLLDVGGVYLVFVALSFYCLSLFVPMGSMSLNQLAWFRFALLLIIASVDVVLITLKEQVPSRIIFSVFMGFLIIATLLQLLLGYCRWITIHFKRPEWAAMSLLFIAAAVLSWVMDRKRATCFKDSSVQGHSIWHVCCATALMCYVCFLRSEVVPSEDEP